MVEIGSGQEPAAEPSRGFEQGTQIGKRYADDQASLEVLCTKGGAGSLSLGSTLLVVEGAKPLPASD